MSAPTEEGVATPPNPFSVPLCFGKMEGPTFRTERQCFDCSHERGCRNTTVAAARAAAAMLNPAPEADPHGLDPHAPGAKLDAGKIRPDLIIDGFSMALWAVAEVGTHGAAKYTEGGWQHVEEGVKRYRAAAGRHRLKRARESHDQDSKLLHLAHEAWNVLAELELTLRKSAS